MNSLTVLPNSKIVLSDSNLSGFMDNFIASMDVKQSSRDTYKKALTIFTDWLTTRCILNPARQDILAYKDSLKDRGLSSFTISGYIVVVRKFFEYLESTIGYQNVAKGIKGAKRAKGFRKDPLTVEQIRELLNRIDLTSLDGKRDYALLNLMVRTGLRTIEIIRADIEDIRQQSGEAVLWIHGKGRETKDEFVILTQEALNPIYEYLTVRGHAGDGEPLFASVSDRNYNGRLTGRSISRIVKSGLRDIHLDSNRLTAHSLRHTFATIALANGAPLLQVKEAMRHNSVETTMIYAHAMDRVSHGAERYVRF